MQALVIDVQGEVVSDHIKLVYDLQLNGQDFPSDSIYTFIAEEKTTGDRIRQAGSIFNNLITFEIPSPLTGVYGVYNYRILETLISGLKRTPVCGRMELKKVPGDHVLYEVPAPDAIVISEPTPTVTTI